MRGKLPKRGKGRAIADYGVDRNRLRKIVGFSQGQAVRHATR